MPTPACVRMSSLRWKGYPTFEQPGPPPRMIRNILYREEKDYGLHEIRTVLRIYLPFCWFSWLFSYAAGRKLWHACIWRLLDNFKGENSLVLETRQANLFGRKTKGESLGASSPKSVNDVISTYLRPDEPLRYDINNRSLQKHFW